MREFITITVFVFIALLGIAPVLVQREKRRIIGRLRYYEPHEPAAEEKSGSDGSGGIKAWFLDRVHKRRQSLSQTERLARDLYWADVKLRPEEYRLIRLLLVLVFFLVYLLTRDVLLSLLALVGSQLAPGLALRIRKGRNLKRLNEQIYYSIGIIAGSLQAGHSFLQSLKIVASDVEDPLRREYARIIKEINLGLPVRFTLTQARDRIDSPDFSLFVNAVLIQLKTGGNLSEILERIAGTIRDRQKLANELNTLTAQGRLSGAIIVLLPIALVLFLYLVNRGHVMTLFIHPLGRLMLLMAVVMQIIGIVLIRRIIHLDTF